MPEVTFGEATLPMPPVEIPTVSPKTALVIVKVVLEQQLDDLANVVVVS